MDIDETIEIRELLKEAMEANIRRVNKQISDSCMTMTDAGVKSMLQVEDEKELNAQKYTLAEDSDYVPTKNPPFSNGNKKIGKDTLIFNMTSSTNCPSKKLGLCKVEKKCYAMKAERMYPDCLPYRERQTKYWDEHTAHEIFLDIQDKVSRMKHEIRYFRFSEAGDFRNQNDIDKMSNLADHLNSINIRVYGYTARSDLDFSNVSDNMVVNGSSFMLDNMFTPIKKEEVDEYMENGLVCPGRCINCDLCKDKTNLDIRIKFH